MARTVVDRNEEGKREAAEEAAALAELQTALMELVAGQVRELATRPLAVASARLDGRIQEAVLESRRLGLERAPDVDRSDCARRPDALRGPGAVADGDGTGHGLGWRWGATRARPAEERTSAVASGHRGVDDADGERDGFGVLLRGGAPAAELFGGWGELQDEAGERTTRPVGDELEAWDGRHESSGA